MFSGPHPVSGTLGPSMSGTSDGSQNNARSVRSRRSCGTMMNTLLNTLNNGMLTSTMVFCQHQLHGSQSTGCTSVNIHLTFSPLSFALRCFEKGLLLNQNVWAEMQLKEQISNRTSHTSPWGLSALKRSTGSHQDCHHSKRRATPACLFPKDAKVQQDSGTQRCQAQGCGDEPKPCPSSLPSPGCRASGSPLDCSYGNGRDHLKQHGLREMEYWFPKVCCKAQCEKAAPTPSHTAPRAPHMHTRTQKRPAGLPQCTGKGCFQSLLVFELLGEPVEAFKEPITAGGTSGLDVPVPLAEGM